MEAQISQIPQFQESDSDDVRNVFMGIRRLLKQPEAVPLAAEGVINGFGLQEHYDRQEDWERN